MSVFPRNFVQRAGKIGSAGIATGLAISSNNSVLADSAQTSRNLVFAQQDAQIQVQNRLQLTLRRPEEIPTEVRPVLRQRCQEQNVDLSSLIGCTDEADSDEEDTDIDTPTCCFPNRRPNHFPSKGSGWRWYHIAGAVVAVVAVAGIAYWFLIGSAAGAATTAATTAPAAGAAAASATTAPAASAANVGAAAGSRIFGTAIIASVLVSTGDCFPGTGMVCVCNDGMLDKRSYKPMKDIQKGDSIYSWCPDKKAKFVNTVTDKKENDSRDIWQIKMKNKKIIECTSDHPLWTKHKNGTHKWGTIKDGNIKPGCFLMTKNNKAIEVASVEKLRGKFKVYDLQLEKPGVFFCNQFTTTTCKES